MDAQTSHGRVDIVLRTRPRSEVVAFGKLMAALATMRAREPLAGFQIEVYEDTTVEVPLSLLTRVVQQFVATPGAWRPDPGDLVGACEKARLEIRRSLQFEPCELCSQQGWVEREIDGVRRMARCQCWTAHQEKVKALGVGDKPLAMLALPVGEFEQVADS